MNYALPLPSPGDFQGVALKRDSSDVILLLLKRVFTRTLQMRTADLCRRATVQQGTYPGTAHKHLRNESAVRVGGVQEGSINATRSSYGDECISRCDKDHDRWDLQQAGPTNERIVLGAVSPTEQEVAHVRASRYVDWCDHGPWFGPAAGYGSRLPSIPPLSYLTMLLIRQRRMGSPSQRSPTRITLP
jgi:hypothetical protein